MNRLNRTTSTFDRKERYQYLYNLTIACVSTKKKQSRNENEANADQLYCSYYRFFCIFIIHSRLNRAEYRIENTDFGKIWPTFSLQILNWASMSVYSSACPFTSHWWPLPLLFLPSLSSCLDSLLCAICG